MKTARILFAVLFALAVVPFVSGTAHAGTLQQLTGAIDTLSDSRPAQAATHTFTFTVGTGAGGFDLKYVKLQYCKEAYGDNGTCTLPTGLGINITGDNGSLASLAGSSLAGTFTSTYPGSSNYVLLTNSGADTIADGTVLKATLAGVTNNAISGCNNSNASSGTCYVRLYLCKAGTGADKCDPTLGDTTVAAQTIVSYTVVSDVTVSARVDPSFTFVVEGMGQATAMTNAGVSTSVASDYNTLPFGHLTPGVVKYAAHKLSVTMNTTAGYTVTMKMRQQMTGVYTANNIDPFNASSVSWTSPQSWVHPSTSNTANSDTGWIGANVEAPAGTVPTGWGTSSAKWGPVNSQENTVMQRTTSDNGLTPTYVTYAIDVNVNQPSDTYTGYLVYNALPTY